MFVITARKVLFISLEVSTEQVISEQNYDIVDSGKDDTVTTNSLFTTGRKKRYSDFQDFGSLPHASQYSWTTSQSWTDPTGYTPVVERVIKVTRDGTEIYAEPQVSAWSGSGSSTFNTDTYKLNDDNTIQFWNHSDSSNHTYVIYYEYTYTYNRSSTISNPWSTTQFKQDTSSPSSITVNGLYHRNINVPQLANGFDVGTFNTNYIADYKDINPRHKAITSSLVNSLTVGQKVRYTDSTGTSERVIRSIEYSYPQTLTVIELGEFMFSGFDVEKQTTESLRGLDSSTNISRY